MAALPIRLRDIVTPYLVWGEEKADIISAANNRLYVTRGGGYRYRIRLNIRPFNILAQDQQVRFEALRAFLTKYPQFSVPIINTVPNNVSDAGLYNIDTPDGTHNEVGGYTVKVPASSWSTLGQFNPGQYIKFSDKAKVYQVESQNSNIITLTQRIRNKLDGSENIIFQEPIAPSVNYFGIQWSNENFNGVMCDVVNEDFGNPSGSVEDGILGNINTLVLLESI